MGARRISAGVLSVASVHDFAAPLSNEPTFRVEVTVQPGEVPETESWLRQQGITDFKAKTNTVLQVFASHAELRTLRRNRGLNVQVVEHAQCRQAKTVGAAAAVGWRARRPGHQPLRAKLARAAIPEGYSDLAAIYAYLNTIASTYPRIAQVLDSRDFSVGTTFEGRVMPLIKISANVTVDEDEPVLFMNSAHHSREIVTPHLAMDTIRRLTSGYGVDSTITAFLNTHAIIVAPLWNPDGYVYTWDVNNMWRKNRKPASDGRNFGVDQNRNYDIGWDNGCSGSTVPSSDTYRGVSPASEEETQIMKAIQSKYNIVRRVLVTPVQAKLLDFHSSGREVLVSYRCEPIPGILDSYIKSEGTILADQARYDTRLPSSDGEHQEWTIANVTPYAFLVETYTEFQPPFSEAQAEAERVWPLVQTWMAKPIPLSGHITAGGRPVAADITINELTSAFVYHSEPTFGRYHIFLPTGSYTLVVSAPGYPTRSIPVSINNNAAQTLEIQL